MTLLANINIGASANDGAGDPLRTAFTKANQNFQIISNLFPTAANANVGDITAGNITASYFTGNGSQLTGILAAPSGTAVYVTGNTQANITAVGTLSSLTVTGNISSGNVSGTNLTGTLTTANQPNITNIGTVANLTISSGITASTGNNFTLSNLRSTLHTITNNFGSNALATSNVNLSLNATTTSFAQLAANVTISYPVITAGVFRQYYYKNVAGTTVYITLPNSNNNKGTNVIPVSANTVAEIRYMAADTTEPNVVAIITND